MKKIILLFIAAIFFQNFCFASYIDKQLKNAKNNKYNSVKIYTTNTMSSLDSAKIKDPKLIKLSNCKEIGNSEYDKKLKQDEKEYSQQHKNLSVKKESSSIKQPLSNDLYNLYRVTERILRANNLDYINWRVVLYNDTNEYNAYTTSANLIAIFSGLYDSLYNNDDALAFIVSHELSHQILGHIKKVSDLNSSLRRWVADGQRGTLDLIYYKKLREIELEADSQAIELLSRAGYSTNKAMDAINFMEAMPDRKSLYSTHPDAKQRKENAMEISKYTSPDWEKEGRFNLFNSKVLEVKKSSDKVSFVIVGENKINPYELENYEKRLLRYAYVGYLNSENKNAVKYFEKLIQMSPKYEYYLYLSYAYENLYKETKKDKYLQEAINSAQQAKNISDNKHTKEQLDSLKAL